jgi:L-malate glycosyltransferase
MLNTCREGAPLRVLLVVDSLEMGGAERHVTDVAVELARRGHAVHLAASTGGILSSRLGHTNIQLNVCSPQRVKRAASRDFTRGLQRLIRGERYDLVHSHLYGSAVATEAATRGTAMPCVITEHSEGNWRTNEERALSARYLRRADRVVAVSRAVHLEVQKIAGGEAAVAEIANAVPRIPRSFGGNTGRDAPVIGFVGRLCTDKGADLFVELAASLAGMRSDVRFLLVGDGPLREQLHSTATHLGISRRLEFAGEVEDARALLSQMDVLVVPSRTDAAPLVVLEAMAAGTPVVARRVGGIPDQVRDSQDGFVVEPNDVEALAASAVLVLEDQGLRERLVGSAREREGATSFDNVVNRLEDTYRLAISDRRRRTALSAAVWGGG